MSGRTAKKLNQPSHLKDLILLFSIPVGIAVFAAIAVYAPRLLANPKYDFIYSVCSDYDCNYDFNIDGSGYVSQYSMNRDYRHGTSTLRYYNAKDDSTRSLTLEEARRYRLNTSSKSPDGYSLTREEGDSGFLFWGNYKSGWYLKNGAKKKEVELSTDDSYYSRDVNFLGWINQ
ncbi:MAG: hypothetical protein AAB459_00035 [Patescibacteria group bacterium]|jgi:hypothetical protein